MLAELPQLETARPPRPSVSGALRRHWRIAILPVIVLVAVALAAGYLRAPTYTAEVELAIGQVDSAVPGALGGFTAAVRSLTDTYSRSIRSDEIIEPAAQRLGVDPDDIRYQVTAAPVPESSVMGITASTSSPVGAVELANVTAASFVRYTEENRRSNPESDRLFAEYQRASASVEEEKDAVKLAREEKQLLRSEEADDAVTDAKAAADAADLRRDSLRAAYQVSLQASAGIAVADVIEPALGASSDRFSVLQLLLFIAVAAGLAIGVALALLRANWQTRRVLA